MTIANELKDTGLKICVLESGTRKQTKRSNRLRTVRSEGIQIKEWSRERVLGGASTTWSGLSAPLDAIDFKPRRDRPFSGWPITREELLPFYDETARRYRFPPLSVFQAGGFGVLKAKGDRPLALEHLEEKVFLAPQGPQNFGREYEHIFQAHAVDLYLDATVTELKGANGAGRVSFALVRASTGSKVSVEARAFVLATGAIENARILLCSRDLCSRGLGNENDQVGRYFMNHPKSSNGLIYLDSPVRNWPYYFGCLYQGAAGFAGFRLNDALQEKSGYLNSYVRFKPVFPWSDNRGVETFILLAGRFKWLLKSWKTRKKGKVVPLRDFAETGDDTDLMNGLKTGFEWVTLFLTVIVNLPRVLQYLYFRLRDEKAPEVRCIRIGNYMEMEPDPENRVLLADECDDFGQPVPIVRHRCTERDERSLVALHETLKGEVSRNAVGRLVTRLREEKPWPITDASHHMGTTRMGTEPRTSVVNPDCRIHGIENVYLAGGSVFPTSGCANPTYTMVALSIRLAAHLKSKVLECDPTEKRTE